MHEVTISFSNHLLRIISDNHIQDTGLRAIADGLHHNSSLIVLLFQHATFGPQAGQAFSDALEVNRKLRILKFTECAVMDDALARLAPGLRQNRSLHQLYLDSFDSLT